tara:strand:- start:879 stop:1139 length:261 start_codon:yes stop_codon:yes gene_type:complete
MSDIEDRRYAKETLKKAKKDSDKDSANVQEAKGILSGVDGEQEDYRPTTIMPKLPKLPKASKKVKRAEGGKVSSSSKYKCSHNSLY